ncbi:MAG TPA: ferritin-like domain-containing protein [Gaiellaceae bacterium]
MIVKIDSTADMARDDASRGGGPSRRSVVLASGAAVVAATPLLRRLAGLGDAAAAPSRAQDAQILQLVLQLEHTQVAFYEDALRQASLDAELNTFARTALDHERQHLAAIEKALGGKKGPTPKFDFGDKTKSAAAFTKAAIQLEDIAVAGYNGQAGNLTKSTLAAAAEIVSVEARHAAWVRALAGQVAAPEPVDKPLTAKAVAQGLREIGLRA